VRATARLRRWACRTGSPVMRFSAWAWVGGLPTRDHHHPTHPSPALSFVDDCLVLAATNKSLAQSNKSRLPSKATKRAEWNERVLPGRRKQSKAV
jgi:hypothetical protein